MTITSSLRSRLVLLSCAALLAACSSDEGGGGLDGFGAKYKIAENEIPGWTQETSADAFSLFTADSLTEKIDGQADAYVARGLNYALYQSLVGPDPANCTFIAMDMGSDANAATMVSYQQTTMSASLAIPGYDASVAIASEALFGITVYAHFKNLYLEIILDGYGSDRDAPAQVGAKFLQVSEAKTK